MCEFCGSEDCTLTKEQVIAHGPIIESNAMSIMRELDGGIYTYSFKGVPCYNSLSALIPDENEENPHAYMRYDFDEDEGCYDGDIECHEVGNPLKWQTEKEFLEKINQDYSKYYNNGNGCDNCKNQYLCGVDGDAVGCKCADEGRECNFVQQNN